MFALGFLIRPLGGWLLGRYADRHGRRAALTGSVYLMCLGSLMIAATPGYGQIGIAAPLLLLLARLLQGLSVGGEYGASATYLSEIAISRRRGFYSSFQYVTLIMGQLLALGVLVLLQRVFLTERQLQDWGWRIPFIIGALCAVGTAILRRGMEESPAFKAPGAARAAADAARLEGAVQPAGAPRGTAGGPPQRGSLRRLLDHPREVLTVVGLTLGGTLSFYTFTTYTQKFLVNTAGFDNQTAAAVCALAMLVFMLLQPLVGLLSDFVGRRPVLLAFGVLGTICTVPLMRALATAASAIQAFVLIVIALTIVSGYTAVNAIVKAELFPTEVRALGVALPYAMTVALFGGSAESVALWTKSIGHESAFYWYVCACTAISLIVYLLMPETRRHSRIPAD